MTCLIFYLFENTINLNLVDSYEIFNGDIIFVNQKYLLTLINIKYENKLTSRRVNYINYVLSVETNQ